MPSETIKFEKFVVEHRVVDKHDPTIIRPHQVHGGTITSSADLGTHVNADGVVVTQASETPVAIFTADCLPLVLAGDDTAVLLHVSRKSIINDLLYNTKQYLPPTKIKQVYIGPHICSKHFTFAKIGEELQEFCRQFPAACDLRKPVRISLRHAVQQYLNAWNIGADKIVEDGRCTYEDSTLPSYRRSIDRNESLVMHLATIITFKS